MKGAKGNSELDWAQKAWVDAKGTSPHEQVQVGIKGKSGWKQSREPVTPIGNNSICKKHWLYTNMFMYSLYNVKYLHIVLYGAEKTFGTIEIAELIQMSSVF